ncbi:MAG: type IVB secretion system protein IcmH/DotU, partial [Phreatobacter sp.]|uniref:type IVB secretion system protein IcmH/DotU n=1 Tax=Phreatobacter sp. TaxID=1966341 RepID=UPI002732AB8A
DDPTVVGHRPIGPSRGGQRRPPGGGPHIVDPVRGQTAAEGQGDIDAALSNARAPASQGTGLALQPGLDEPDGQEDTLAAAAGPLLLLAAKLRESVENADVAALRREIVDQARRFEERAVRFGARAGDISAARYVLCSMLDELVMSTPWGSRSNWSANSLLNQFHNETWGGEKVFEILERVKGEPSKYIALLKLIDLCLLLGFEGKFRVIDGGRERLDELREELGRLLRQYGSVPAKELSANWMGVSGRKQLKSYMPLWVVFAGAAILMIGAYGALQWRLGTAIAPVEQRLDAILRGEG